LVAQRSTARTRHAGEHGRRLRSRRHGDVECLC
jgi:hypothetical protein